MIREANSHSVADALSLLRQGELVAFPTETVYGLGADASNEAAVAKIFAAKGRPSDHPLIVHLAHQDALDEWASDIPKDALKLAEAFWPGPLTLILKRSSRVPDLVTGSQNTVGLRIPSHPVALALLDAFAGGVAAPSANRFGRISPTTAQHVEAELADHVKLILDGGACQVGLESTIVDLSTGQAKVLRPGGVSLQALSNVLGFEPEVLKKSKVKASGTLDSHYAPTKPTYLVKQIPSLDHIGVLSREAEPDGFSGLWLQADQSAEAYAQQLYSRLRILDASQVDSIYIEDIPTTKDWLAVQDRLERASFASNENESPEGKPSKETNK